MVSALLSPVPQTVIRAGWLFISGGRGTVWTHSLLVVKQHSLVNSGSMQVAILLAACILCRNSAIGATAPV